MNVMEIIFFGKTWIKVPYLEVVLVNAELNVTVMRIQGHYTDLPYNPE